MRHPNKKLLSETFISRIQRDLSIDYCWLSIVSCRMCFMTVFFCFILLPCSTNRTRWIWRLRLATFCWGTAEVRGCSFQDIRDRSLRLDPALCGRSKALTTMNASFTRPWWKTRPVTLCPDSTGKSVTKARVSSKCRICSTDSPIRTSWTSSWAHGHSSNPKWPTRLLVRISIRRYEQVSDAAARCHRLFDAQSAENCARPSRTDHMTDANTCSYFFADCRNADGESWPVSPHQGREWNGGRDQAAIYDVSRTAKFDLQSRISYRSHQSNVENVV